MKVVRNANQALDNIARLQTEWARSPDLVKRVSLVHAWYVDTRDPEHPLFGFSTFVGYQDLNAESYLRDYKELNRMNTEWVLKGLFEELGPRTPEFRRYHSELTDWLDTFGRAPRKKVRLMVLKPEFREDPIAADRRLLDLLTAVADMLPLNQRHELRARL